MVLTSKAEWIGNEGNFQDNVIRGIQAPFGEFPCDVLVTFQLGDNFVTKIRSRLRYLGDCHQIVKRGNKIYLCNTRSNAITVENLTGSTHEIDVSRYDIFLGDASAENRRDINHLNSLSWFDGSLYCLLHNSAAGLNSTVVEIIPKDNRNFDLGEQWNLPTSGAHDIEITDKFFYYCDSTRGTVIEYDYRKREKVREMVLGGHTKGLELRDNIMLCGSSAFSPMHETRQRSPAEVVVIDIDKWEVIARPTIQVAEKDIGNINDILWLP
jgi:hypothetical protein